MERINVAELLRSCPSGMKLDCTLIENLYFDRIIDSEPYDPCSIQCYTQDGSSRAPIVFNEYGHFTIMVNSKCVIFPEGKTTWEGFVPPSYKLKEGDIVFTSTVTCSWVSIFKQFSEKSCFTYTDLCIDDNDLLTDTDTGRLCLCHLEDIKLQRIATEEEKEKLFQAIRDNGYNWNEETKTLEKLIEPEFNVEEHEENENILNYKAINSSVNKENFYFGVHCRNASETRDILNWPNDELFRYSDGYSDLFDCFAEYLDDVEEGPHIRFKSDDNNPYSGPDIIGFGNYLYHEQNGIFIHFEVNNGKITDWTWDDKPKKEYKHLEYDDFKIMIQDIYKSDSIEKIITSDIVDKYCNKSNTDNNDNKTEDIITTSTPEVNFDILFDYGTLIGIGDSFVRKSDISAFVKDKLADADEHHTVVVLKSGAKLTFHDIDYEEFIAELDKYYRFKGDILE